jgi:hypothetical protein
MQLCKSRDDKPDSFPAIQDALLEFFFFRNLRLSRHLIAHGFRLQALSPEV